MYININVGKVVLATEILKNIILLLIWFCDAIYIISDVMTKWREVAPSTGPFHLSPKMAITL